MSSMAIITCFLTRRMGASLDDLLPLSDRDWAKVSFQVLLDLIADKSGFGHAQEQTEYAYSVEAGLASHLVLTAQTRTLDDAALESKSRD